MADIDIDYYCRAYDDFLSPADCEEYIDKYEETLRVDNERWKELSICFKDDGSKHTPVSYTHLTLPTNREV